MSQQPNVVAPGKLSPISMAVLIVAFAVTAAFYFSPEVSKPLFLKYYRAVYGVQVTR